MDNVWKEHEPYVEKSECEFGDHEYWSCSCGWSASSEFEYSGGGQEFVKHIISNIESNNGNTG